MATVEEIKASIKKRKSEEGSKTITDILSSSEKIPDTGDPLINAGLYLQKEWLGPAVQGINTAAFGLPKLAAQRFDPNLAKDMFPEQSTFMGKTRRLGSEAIGLMYGGSGKLGQAGAKLGTKAFGDGVTGHIMSGGLGGGLTGVSQIFDPKGSNEDILKRQAIQGAGSALAGITYNTLAPFLKKVASGVKNMKNIKGENAVKFEDATRAEFYNIKKEAVDSFGSQLDDLAQSNPNKTVDLTSFADDLAEEVRLMNGSSKNILYKSKLLKEIVDNPDKSRNVSLKEIQKMINDIQSGISKNIKSQHIEALDKLSDLRASQLDAFPEMASVREQYRQIAEPHKQLKKYFNFNKLQQAINNDFDGPVAQEALKGMLSKETIEKMGGIKNALDVMNLNQRLIQDLLIGISSGVGAGIVFRQMQGDRE